MDRWRHRGGAVGRLRRRLRLDDGRGAGRRDDGAVERPRRLTGVENDEAAAGRSRQVGGRISGKLTISKDEMKMRLKSMKRIEYTRSHRE